MKNKSKAQSRLTNFELLRIVSMLMIVTLHYLDKGKLLNENIGSKTYYIAWMLETLSYVAVNIYVMISGYFVNKSVFKFNKMLDLWIQTIVISGTAFIIALKTGIIENSTYDIFTASFFPITHNAYWFITTYFVFLAINPFLFYVTEIINKKQHKILCITLIIITSVLPTLFFETDWLKITKGYSIIWFITLFFVASYIRKYDSFKRKPIVYFAGYLLTCVIAFSSRFIMKYAYASLSNSEKDFGLSFFNKYNMFFVFLASVFLFLAFKNIKINNTVINKIICFISPAMVYVYLVHEAPSIRTYLWGKLVCPLEHGGFPDLIINYILGIGGVFITGVIIGKLLVFVYNFLRINKLTLLIGNRASALAKRIVTDENISE